MEGGVSFTHKTKVFDGLTLLCIVVFVLEIVLCMFAKDSWGLQHLLLRSQASDFQCFQMNGWTFAGRLLLKLFLCPGRCVHGHSSTIHSCIWIKLPKGSKGDDITAWSV